MKKLTLRDASGFSLIELLVVAAILGILAAIAIPQFEAYRKKGYEATLQSDLANAATAQESYFAETQTYKTGPLSSGTPPGYNQSVGITSITSVAGLNSFRLSATHVHCSGITWTYDNTVTTGIPTGPPCP